MTIQTTIEKTQKKENISRNKRYKKCPKARVEEKQFKIFIKKSNF
jgi:hypothetical protein